MLLGDAVYGDANTIFGTTPSRGEGSVDVTVIRDDAQDTLVAGFTYAAPPSLFALVPSQGEGDEDVTLLGDNFTAADDPDLQIVYGIELITTFEVIDETQINFRVPPCGGDTGWKSIAFTTSGGVANMPEAYLCGSIPPPITFRRGDPGCDGSLDIGDAVRILSHLFGAVKPPVCCEDAMDLNDDGFIDISDPIYELQFLFANGAAPKAPHPGLGTDPTFDGLGCAEQCGCSTPPCTPCGT
jgi:hypothetical protein